MGTGAITSYVDVAQITLYVFWGFFAGLAGPVYYRHREDKREGCALESDRSGGSLGWVSGWVSGRVSVQGCPAVPRPNTSLLRPAPAGPLTPLSFNADDWTSRP